MEAAAAPDGNVTAAPDAARLQPVPGRRLLETPYIHPDQSMNTGDLITVVIVSWNTLELTARCIESIYERNKGDAFEIIVVDNASTDGSADHIEERFPDIRLIRNVTNAGFARANNQAIALAKGAMILLLNSDCVLSNDSPFGKLRAHFASNPRTGIIGAGLVLPDGRLQPLGRRFVTVKSLVRTQLLFSQSPLSRGGRPDGREVIPADYVDGAFLAIRSEVADGIGPMNEDYFMYAEDMEWCAAARAAGWEVVVLPRIEVLHYHASSARKNFRAVLVNNAVNISKFLAHHEDMKQAKRAFLVLTAGMLLRVPVNLARDPSIALDYVKAFFDCARFVPKLGSLLCGGGIPGRPTD